MGLIDQPPTDRPPREPSVQHWQLPAPPSRGLRLLVFAAIVVVIAAIAVWIVAFAYTLSLASPAPSDTGGNAQSILLMVGAYRPPA